MSENQTNTKSIEKFLTELDVLIRARYPLIAVNTYEEDRVRDVLVDLVFRKRHKEKPLYFWSRPLGLQKIVDPKEGVLQNPAIVGDTEDPESILSFIAEPRIPEFFYYAITHRILRHTDRKMLYWSDVCGRSLGV